MPTSSIFIPVTDNLGSNAPHAQPVMMDQDYFMDLSPVTFQVENYLFRVPRYNLMKGSETFVKMFQSQQIKGSLEDSSTENPIVLPVSRVDFRNFLKLLYPQTVLLRVSLSMGEWLSVLKLSTLWRFRYLRQMALSELRGDDFDYLSPLERIEIGRKYYVPDCLLSGYLGFVTGYDSITDEEATEMGPLTAVRLCRIRENFFFDGPKADERAGKNIEEEFHQELVDLRKYAEGYLLSSWPAEPPIFGDSL